MSHETHDAHKCVFLKRMKRIGVFYFCRKHVFYGRKMCFTDLLKTHVCDKNKTPRCVSCVLETHIYVRLETLKCVFEACVSEFYSEGPVSNFLRTNNCYGRNRATADKIC